MKCSKRGALNLVLKINLNLRQFTKIKLNLETYPIQKSEYFEIILIKQFINSYQCLSLFFDLFCI